MRALSLLLMAGIAHGFHVDRVTPDVGSLAGGQLLTVHGSGLMPEPTNPVLPATVVTIGGVPCDIQRTLSTGARLVCKTRPFPGAGLAKLNGVATQFSGRDRGCSGLDQVVSVVVNGVGGDIRLAWNSPRSRCRRGANRECTYNYFWQSTPQLAKVTPRSPSPGSVITVSGRTGIADLYDDNGQISEAGLKRFERTRRHPAALESGGAEPSRRERRRPKRPR